jgi:hypothetical protein
MGCKFAAEPWLLQPIALRICAASLDHLVGDREHRRRQSASNLLGALQVEDELKFRRLFDREVRWPCAFRTLSTYFAARRLICR